MTKFVDQFFTFLKTFGVVGLAIAFVIGQASSSLISSLVIDIINPFVGLFIPNGNLNGLTVKIMGIGGGMSEFKVGDLILSILNFLIIALLIFIAYRELSKLHIVENKV